MQETRAIIWSVRGRREDKKACARNREQTRLITHSVRAFWGCHDEALSGQSCKRNIMVSRRQDISADEVVKGRWR